MTHNLTLKRHDVQMTRGRHINILCTYDLGHVSTGNSITDTNNSTNTIPYSQKLIQQEKKS